MPDSSSERKSSNKSKTEARTTRSSGNVGVPDLGPVIFMGGPGRTHTREVTREVVKEVEVPVAPRSIDCPYCGRSYVPAEQDYACPACGAATPTELIQESESPKDRSEN